MFELFRCRDCADRGGCVPRRAYDAAFNAYIAEHNAALEGRGPLPESAWLIEHHSSDGGVYWWTGRSMASGMWTEKHEEAVRFARLEDAQRVIDHQGLRDFARPSEHMWMPRLPDAAEQEARDDSIHGRLHLSCVDRQPEPSAIGGGLSRNVHVRITELPPEAPTNGQ